MYGKGDLMDFDNTYLFCGLWNYKKNFEKSWTITVSDRGYKTLKTD